MFSEFWHVVSILSVQCSAGGQWFGVETMMLLLLLILRMIRIDTIFLNGKGLFFFFAVVVAICFTERLKNMQPRLQTLHTNILLSSYLAFPNDLSIHSSQPRPSAMLPLPPLKHLFLHDISRFTSL